MKNVGAEKFDGATERCLNTPPNQMSGAVLHRLRFHRNAFEMRKPVVECHPVVRPEPLDDLEILTKAGDPSFRLKAIGRINLVLSPSPTPTMSRAFESTA